MKQYLFISLCLTVFMQAFSQSDIQNKVNINDKLKALYFEKKLVGEDERIHTVPYGVAFAGTEKEWQQLLRCGLDKSVLEKNHSAGKKLQVIVKFVLPTDGQPCQLTVEHFPEECPDCAVEALKLFYKHIVPGTEGNCNIVTTKEPYKQWIASEGMGHKVASYVSIIIPFGYEDQQQQDIHFSDTHIDLEKNKKENNNNNVSEDQGVVTSPQNNEDDAEDKTLSPESQAAANDIAYIKANVVKQGTKYILTVLGDKSIHTVFRPIPKEGDITLMNKYNSSIPLNQGAWGEVTTGKSGTPMVKFYSFTGADNAVTNAMTLADFKKVFYDPK